MDRRDFFKVAGASGVLASLPVSAAARLQNAAATDDRARWTRLLQRVADPVLTHLASGTLKARMPVEQAPGATRQPVTHLEALGRLMAGLAPWIELAPDQTPEGRLRAQYADLAARSISRAVDPSSPDFLNFTRDRQPLVDAAFLAQGLLRAPRALRDALEPPTKRQLIAALESTRAIVPGFNNWLLFSATVEAGLARLGASWDRLRVDYGSFPAIGRSLAYRCGAFHLLAQMALRGSIPASVSPAQVRGALTAVIRRTLEAPGTFDADGWMQIGFCGHQPGVGETYISTGSLYLCSVAFLPLGLPATHAFWSAPAQPWTSARAWAGQAFPIDHAL
jgi:hypothetical protein